MNEPISLVMCTCPDRECAGQIARVLLQMQLAACVNLLPGITSWYRWQGNIEQSEEVLLLIKTTPGQYSQLQQCIRNHHPYELPEIVMVTSTDGLPDYLDWVHQETTHRP